MKIYTAHIGPISPERQRCLDRQREVYGDDWTLVDSGIEAPFIREKMDLSRFYLIKDGGLYIDSDVYPNERWEPSETGLYVCHSWGRPDYWTLCNNGADALVEEAIAYGEKVLAEAGGAGPGTFLWPLRWIVQNMDRIKLIEPQTSFSHLYLSTSKSQEKQV